MTPQEEQQLVISAQTNVESFEKLYDLYFPKVFGFVMGKIQSRSITEDLVSEMFIKILEALPRYQFRGLPFGAWVFRIVRNHLKDYYGKAKRKNFDHLENADWLEDGDKSRNPDEIARQNSLRTTLVNSFHVLNDQEEEVVRLKYFSELQNKEISDILGISPNNVGVILFRALKKLKSEHDQ
jgi:RNA polymerase sigma-70 factor, ECF subfamily